MSKTMTVDKALAMVKDVAAAKAKWGRYASPPVTQDELLEALLVLSTAGNFDAPSAEEVTKLKRQLAACQNREKGRKGNGPESNPETEKVQE